MNKTSSLFFFVLYQSHTIMASPHAITYKLNPGRFGDHLLTYCKAKIISHEHNLPLLYQPFKHSDMLTLHNQEQVYKAKDKKKFKRTVAIKDTFGIKSNASTLYLCTLKTRLPHCDSFGAMYRYVQNNPAFKAQLLELLTPTIPLQTIELPTNTITIAVHVRKGGGYDQPLYTRSRKLSGYADKTYPTRFPPEAFYIEQIKKIAHLFADQPLFVHIFTDDQNPPSIVARFKQQLSDYPISFSCRQSGNQHNAYVLDDLFAMIKFDCLIRPASSYSKMAQLLGDHKVIIYPTKAEWIGATLVVTKVGVINNL